MKFDQSGSPIKGLYHRARNLTVKFSTELHLPPAFASAAGRCTKRDRGGLCDQDPPGSTTGIFVDHGILIDSGDQARGSGAVGIVLGAKLRPQQPLFGLDARNQRRDGQHRQQHADPRPKGERPAQ